MKTIAVIGENAIKMMTVGGGSSSLKAIHEILPLDGLKNRIGNTAKVIYARGYASNDYKDQFDRQFLYNLLMARFLSKNTSQNLH